MVNEYLFNRDVQAGIGYDLRVSRISKEELVEIPVDGKVVAEVHVLYIPERKMVKTEDK